MHDYLVAYMLLFGPQLTDEQYAANYNPFLIPALQQVMVDHDYIGRNQTAQHLSFISTKESFSYGIKYYRAIIKALEGTPPSTDRINFSYLNHLEIESSVSFNRRYHEFLLNRKAFSWDKDQIDEILIENNSLYEIYAQLNVITSSHAQIEQIRQSLGRLKELIGEKYYTRDLPPCVPLWRFQEID